MSLRLAYKRSLQDTDASSAPSSSPYDPEVPMVDDDEIIYVKPRKPVPKRNQKPAATTGKRRSSPRQKTITEQPSASARGKGCVRAGGKRKRDSTDDVVKAPTPRKRSRVNPIPSTPETPSQAQPIESSVVEIAPIVADQSQNLEASITSSPLSAPQSCPVSEASLKCSTTFRREQKAEGEQVDVNGEHDLKNEILLTATAAQQTGENSPPSLAENPESSAVLPMDALRNVATETCPENEAGAEKPQKLPTPPSSVSSSQGTENNPQPNTNVEPDASAAPSTPLLVSDGIVDGEAISAESRLFPTTPASIERLNRITEERSPISELDADCITVASTKSAVGDPKVADAAGGTELDVQLPTPSSLVDSPPAPEESQTTRRRSGRTTQPRQREDGMVEFLESLEESDVANGSGLDYEDPNMGDLGWTMSSDDTPSKPGRKKPGAQKAQAPAQAPKMKTSLEESKITKRGRPKKVPQKRKTSTSNSDIEISSLAKTPKSDKPKATRRKSVKVLPPKLTSPTTELRPATQTVTTQMPSRIVRLPAISRSILDLSKRLTQRAELPLKPEPQGRPLVWADSRQALCETLPYFKKPQGGCYQNEGHIYGFLFDSVGHCREYMDENVIICRAGGGMESDPSGGMVQRKDQLMKEAQVQAILNDIEHQNPIVVICGNRNVSAPCKMPHQYCVLGWYKPVRVWSEKTAGKGTKVWKTIKYRLERLDQLEPAWYAPTDSQLSSRELSADTLMFKECGHCKIEYPQVYLQSWMCLNQDCGVFWKIDGEDAPLNKAGLDYNPAFLLHREAQWGDESKPPANLRPPVPNIGNVIGDNITYINTRGICCPKCGRCNSRRLFLGWKCENLDCDFELFPQHRPVVLAMLHTPWDAAPTLVRNKYDSSQGVKLKVEHKHGYKISTYTFEKLKGRFIHAAASKDVVQETGGPNDMFAQIQIEDLGLERRTFATKKMSGGRTNKSTVTAEAAPGILDPPADVVVDLGQSQESIEQDEDGSAMKKPEYEDGDLMTAFSMNFGMPYKFVASGASRPFEPFKINVERDEVPGAPEPVKECRRRLNWAQREFLDERKDYKDFNEELIFAYMEGQKIEYHDDGEEGLGPRIATLSLGGRAKMHIRMKQKHYVGCSKNGIFTEEEPMPGSIDGPAMYGKRHEKWKELQSLKGDDGAAYTKRRKEIPKELGIFEKRMKKADDLVTVTLSHGDIIIMDGDDIQKYLEHKVVPEGYLRFALTCRTVLGNHLKPEELPGYPVEEDPVLYAGPSTD